MNNIITQFAHIFIHYYSNKAYSTCKLFISEPTKGQEAKMGRLFGILEINTPSRENASIITQLINELEEAYYSQSDEDNLDIEKALEKTLADINQKFSQLIKEKRFYLVGNLNEHTVKEKINFVVGVLSETQTYLSYLNNIGLFLIHKTKQDYKLIDIKKLAPEEKKAEETPKLFSNLLAGELKAADYLFLCNTSFLDIVSQERILKTVTSLPIHKAAEYFKNSLLQHEGHNFAAVIIKNSAAELVPTQDSSSLTSITELNLTETSTERLLEPSFWVNLKSIPLSLIAFFNKPKTEKTAPEKKIPSNSSKFYQPLANFFHNLIIKIKKLFKNLAVRTPALTGKLQASKNFFRLKMAYLGSYLKKIPNLSKILLIAAILLIILFVYSTSYFKHQQLLNAGSKEFQDIASQIEELKNQADSDLIYGDETKARSEITQAQNLLNSLTVKSQKQKERQEQLSQSIETVVAKLRHITMISEPILISDLSTQQENNINLLNLILQNNQVLAFDSLNNYIYQINLDTREVKKITSNLSDIGQFIKAKKIDDQVLLYHDKNGFVQFKDEKLMPLSAGLLPNSKIIDFASYNSRLYTVDVNSNQIYRLAKADSGYGLGAAWLKESLDFTNIISFGIDTNIWLLDKTGQIIKLNKGKKQNFTINNLEPALEAPSQLLTTDETNYLYILEPKNKRLVVLDKEGNLITQYFSPAFDNLKAFEIMEKEKKIFVINDNKIYFFNLTHIN